MRLFRQKVDHGTDKLLVAALVQVHPDQVKGWTILAVLGTGQGKVQSTACCLAHAGEDIRHVFLPVLAEFPTCPGEDG